MQFNGKTPSAFMHVDAVGIIADNAVGNFGWSSRNIVDKLCPAFEESGSVVTCEPFEGYPLEVVSVIPETQLTINGLRLFRGGKNLFDFQSGVYPVTYITPSGTESTRNGFAIRLPAGTYHIHAENSRTDAKKLILVSVNGEDGASKGRWNVVDNLILNTIKLTIEEGDTIYVFDAVAHTEAVSKEEFSCYDIQLEAGGTATPYEEYRGEVFTADFSKFPNRANDGGAYNWITGIFTDNAGDEWQHNLETGEFVMVDTSTDIVQVVRSIPALAGTNCLYEASGTVEVKGRKDLVKTIEELTNAIIALGGNI